MSRFPKMRFILIHVCPATAVALVILFANLEAYYEGDVRYFGFPFAYQFDNVVNWPDVFGDGATIQRPRAEIIWISSYDLIALRADIGVGACLIFVAWLTSYVVFKMAERMAARIVYEWNEQFESD